MVTVSLRIFLSAVVRAEFPSLTVTKIQLSSYLRCQWGGGGGARAAGQLAELAELNWLSMGHGSLGYQLSAKAERSQLKRFGSGLKLKQLPYATTRAIQVELQLQPPHRLGRAMQISHFEQGNGRKTGRS